MTTTTSQTGTPSNAALEELRALHRDGRLAAEYHRVRPLLAALADADLLRAGQLLTRLDPGEVTAVHPDTPALTVAVTGHGTLSALLPPLTAELARHGFLCRPLLSDFDRWVFDLSDPASPLYAARPDMVLCVLDPSVVLDEVPVPWTVEDVERVTEAKLALIDGLVARFRDTASGTLVLNTLPLPRHCTAQLVDHRSRARLGAVWRRFNARLLDLAGSVPGLVVVDVDPLLAEGVPADDARMRVYAKAQLSADLLARYARDVGHLARNLVGRTAKCLAVDLDNTLWGGVLGDDGVERIEVADSHRGEAFAAFQRVVKQIGSQGVLLAAVSKNESDLVARALREHPRMTLREEDFVRVIANWRPKHDNLVELAKDLNLAVDALVFADDSSYECGLVAHELPAVTVVPVDEDPALHVEKLLKDGWFDTLELTAADRVRTERYREERVRRDFLDTFASLEDYLRELKVHVRLSPLRADQPDRVERVAQLTLRTNQFNLTTKRLQVADVRALLDDPATRITTIDSADRFGENGLVGVVFTRRADDGVHIDNFLLSCRVFSRGIEQAALATVLAQARAEGASAVHAAYRHTAKNHAVAAFYPRNGFVPLHGGAAEDEAEHRFRHDLAELPAVPEHLHLETAD